MGTATTVNVYFLNLFNFRIYFVEISILLESTPVCASEESLSVASIARAWSSACLRVNFGSARNRLSILMSWTPHTSRSRRMSSNVASNSQCSVRRHNSAKNIVIVAPGCWERVLNLNRCTMVESLGIKWSWASCAKASKLLSFGSGTTRLRTSLHVLGPTLTRRMDLFLSGSVISLASKKWFTHPLQWRQSSVSLYSSNFPNVGISVQTSIVFLLAKNVVSFSYINTV